MEADRRTGLSAMLRLGYEVLRFPYLKDTVMSRKEFDASRMRRMKRVAARHGLTILTAEKIKVLGHPGGHQVRDDETFKIVYGDNPKPFSASLDDVESWLETLDEESH
jgi:hypothetical protein